MKGFEKSNFDLIFSLGRRQFLPDAASSCRNHGITGSRDSGIIAALRDHEIP